MSKKFLSLFAVIGAGLLSLGIVNIVNSHVHHGIDEKYIDENGNLTEPIDIATHTEDEKPEGKYEENVVLVKTYQEIDTNKIDLDVKSIDELYPNSSWKKITLEKTDAFSAVKKLRKTNLFEKVDYNYIMASEEIEIEEVDVSSNPNAGDLPYIESNGVGNAWGWGKYKHNHGEENIDAGGSPDVIIAVIDTGVDYNHVDLRNNIWTNTAEIPGNDIDDDGNGYVDDVHGWDCVNEDNDPIDDNGHGTHVAGIAAAENNDIGTVGVAFNCKIMPIKAGNSSGYFNNDDIAQAVSYAYMNGASVINMSFGGGSISIAAQDALQDAYSQCALIAAAGNNSLCNSDGCPNHKLKGISYPAALNYVIGVMSCNNDGSLLSPFSNFDHYPYNQYEYDCYACGEQVYSTWPNNKIARLSGTSMASPVVAGIAALLRSAYPDRDAYSTKYIHSQLSNSGSKHPLIDPDTGIDQYHPVCDAYEALTNIPKPHIYNLFNYYAFDNVEFGPNNNGDGFIDAGETIRIGIELQNRGGKASNITAKIDTYRNDDPSLVDPNINITTDTIQFADIGTFSVQDGGKIYDGDKVVNMERAFVADINPNAQNGYRCEINLHLEYYNGLEDDHIKYTSDTSFWLTFSSGQRISGTITEDTVFSADRMYIVDDIVNIAKNVTVTFEAGTIIQFYSDSAAYISTRMNTPSFNVYGNLFFNGTEENPITLKPSSNYWDYAFMINEMNDESNVIINYAKTSNMVLGAPDFNSKAVLNNCIINYDYDYAWYLYELVNGGQDIFSNVIKMGELNNSYINITNGLRFNIRYAHESLIELNGGAINKNNTLIDSDFVNNLFILNGKYRQFESIDLTLSCYFGEKCMIENNSFVFGFHPISLSMMPSISLERFNTREYEFVSTKGNVFSREYKDYQSALVLNNFLYDGSEALNVQDFANHDDSVIWPYIKNIVILDEHDNIVHTVGTEKNKVRVTFSRDMDVTDNFSLFYGSTKPYRDYEIRGEYISDTVWEGELQVKATIEGGIQYFSSKGGCAKGDSFKKLHDTAGYFTFNIDTSSAMSMNLQANPTDQGVELSWVQDDYDTLMGYNVYRSDSKDGNYVKLNTSIIPESENTFLDDSCEPGQTYWYTFTVVLSDFSESGPAGKVSATPIDTIAPTIYHTPVNQGYANNNLVISCTASDNIAVTSATLYYRSVGETTWKTLAMSKANDRFSATIFGSEVTLAGIEYYISATDGRNTVTRGSAEDPYTVIVKDPSLLSNLGDVDGDGAITTKDALMIIRAINDELILTDDQFHRADLNKDGELSTFEALRILQYVNGNVDTLDM